MEWLFRNGPVYLVVGVVVLFVVFAAVQSRKNSKEKKS